MKIDACRWNQLLGQLLFLFLLIMLSASVSLAYDPLTITTEQLVIGKAGMVYNQQLAATGGNASYTWSLAEASRLPMGLKLNSATGVIAGYPVRQGTAAVIVRVNDSEGNGTTKTFNLTTSLPAGAVWQWPWGEPASPWPTLWHGESQWNTPLPEIPSRPVEGIIAIAEVGSSFAQMLGLRYDGTVATWGRVPYYFASASRTTCLP